MKSFFFGVMEEGKGVGSGIRGGDVIVDFGG